ncbi:classical arabinogalactan protein 9 [Actinomyces bowdenii]|uniref:Classical arabinogalactan protein 9 n=1 Tax=Actinomyces bowdenii TaxID=131109 RepID=A0A3P1UTI4_9ACTO|nr:classical arabinogalactan protein 9 [Actinomyces bowdenii]RRD24777.1 classical arabinogalactan protein 9 [Actinomyces bowdenii]
MSRPDAAGDQLPGNAAGQLPMLPIPEMLSADLMPPVAPQSRQVARSAQRQLDELASQSQVAHSRDQARAFLAASAIGNVTTLAALAQASYQAAPAGGPYYQAILRAYGVGATRGIAGF